MPQINTINIDDSEMTSLEQTREISFFGESTSSFTLLVIDISTSSSNQHKFYNFSTDSFDTGHNSLNNNLKVSLLNTNDFSRAINFPSGSGTYIIKAIAADGTKILGKNSYVKTISKQASTTTLTFGAASVANSSSYATLPTTTSVGQSDDSNSFNFSFDITNVSAGFGFRSDASNLPATLNGKFFFFSTTENVLDNPAGDGEDTLFVQVADTTDLGVGMTLHFHKSTTTPVNKAGDAVSPRIDSIDTSNNTIHFTEAVALENGETMTFHANGPTPIFNSIGISYSASNIVVQGQRLSKTIRAGSSGTTINLNGTTGIAGGNNVIISGLGIDNSSANAVTSVSASASAGSIVVQNSQSGLTTGSTINFANCHEVVTISGTIELSNHGPTDRTINLELDRILTLGTAS